MSVLACDRFRCKAIMCGWLILDGSAYICDECWQELLASKKHWPSITSAATIRSRITSFMRSARGGDVILETPAEIEAEFNRLTGQDA